MSWWNVSKLVYSYVLVVTVTVVCTNLCRGQGTSLLFEKKNTKFLHEFLVMFNIQLYDQIN
jgi:hypothetical protein